MKKTTQSLHLAMAIAIIIAFAGVAIAQIGVSGGTFGAFGGGGGGGGNGLGIGGGGRGFRGGGRGGRMGGEYSAGNEPLMPLPDDRDNVPTWPVDPQFKNDAFTFVRLRFTNDPAINRNFGTGGNGGTSWLNDWPPADLNLSFRLQQMTSLKVNPNPIQLEITDPRLFDYPFAYMLQVGALQFTQPQIDALRHWLLNGGFLMVDDHWGLVTQRNWAQQIHRVFPEAAYQPKELTFDHPLFHCVFDLKAMPQVPTLQFWNRIRQTDPEQTWRTPDDPNPHYRAICDDHGRIMVIEDANTDTSDGWEREGDDQEYFQRFSEKIAYPFVINTIFYAMTH